ncbi:uncharacterized protein RAG0_16097 [Rhynchosporium agropyri]|uniref:Uncharacterized protein n=1 Tax=Rhynchosporium agropyri TaxID=914238 RepID=A0A1E1LNU8_9HELO|nr:uncharacterized protein RAG0_16097 [Rhynchosporium agropyri]
MAPFGRRIVGALCIFSSSSSIDGQASKSTNPQSGEESQHCLSVIDSYASASAMLMLM